MSEFAFDKSKGELRVLGRRQMAMTMESLCNHLDLLVGDKVAEVIIKSLEAREGREECQFFRNGKPGATLEEIVEFFQSYDALTGVGITKVILPKEKNDPVAIEIQNPFVKITTGSAKSLLFSWWSGALSELLGRELDIRTVTYDKNRDVLSCTLVTRVGIEQPINRE